MSTFTLTIELGNDAMQTLSDIRDAIAESLTEPEIDDYGQIFNSNGNRVGEWGVTE